MQGSYPSHPDRGLGVGLFRLNSGESFLAGKTDPLHVYSRLLFVAVEEGLRQGLFHGGIGLHKILPEGGKSRQSTETTERYTDDDFLQGFSPPYVL